MKYVKLFEEFVNETTSGELIKPKRGKITKDVSEIVAKVMKEFYKTMWTQRSFWEPRLKNVK